jgi:hypothetical protein
MLRLKVCLQALLVLVRLLLFLLVAVVLVQVLIMVVNHLRLVVRQVAHKITVVLSLQQFRVAVLQVVRVAHLAHTMAVVVAVAVHRLSAQTGRVQQAATAVLAQTSQHFLVQVRQQ